MSAYKVVLNLPYFRKLLAARVISNFGNGMAPTATAFTIFALPGGDETLLSLVLTAQAIPLVLLLPIGGVFADRIGRARIIASMDVVLSVVVLITAAVFTAGISDARVLVPLYAIMGVLNALWYPAYPGLPADLVPEEHLQVANSYISFGSNAALIFGAAAGGWMVSAFGGPVAIAVDGLTFLIAGIVVWALRHTSKRAEESESVVKELHDGWKVFWSYKWVVVVVGAFSIIVLSIRATEGVLGPTVARDHYAAAIGWSQIVAAEGVGLLLGAAIASKWKPSRPLLAGMLMTLPAAGLMLALALVLPLWVVMGAAALWGIGIETFMIWWFTALQNHIPREAIGRVSAYDAFGSLLFGPIGLAIAGPLSANYGTTPVLIGGAALTAAVILFSLLSRDLRALRS